MSAGKENCREVFCIRCNINGESFAVAEKIQSMLKDENINLTILNNVLYDREALDKLGSVKYIFLLETAEKLSMRKSYGSWKCYKGRKARF